MDRKYSAGGFVHNSLRAEAPQSVPDGSHENRSRATKNEQLNQTQTLFQAIRNGDVSHLRAFLGSNPLQASQDVNIAQMALRETIDMNNDEMMRLLLTHCCCDVNKTDTEDHTLLHTAIICGAEKCALALLDDPRTNINVCDSQRWTPLFWAVSKGQLGIVRRLLQMKCDLHCRDASGNFVLHEASEQGHLEVLELILKQGCDVNCVNFNGETPLLLASMEDHFCCVNLLINSGADVNMRSDIGSSPLMYSAICGNDKIAELLLEASADINVKDSEGNSPLILASRFGHNTVVGLLLKHGGKHCDVTVKDAMSRSVLHAAAENNHADIVEALLLHNADPASMDNMGKTALSIAAQNGHVKSLVALVRTTVGVNTADHLSMTPLHWAVIGGHSICVQQLLQHGADPKKCVGGVANTPLILATDIDDKEIVHLLINAGCDVNAFNTSGVSALHRAAERGSLEVIRVLVQAGAYIDAQTSKGDTPLIIATQLGHVNIVKFLLDIPCDVTLTNSAYTTALHIACLIGQSEIVQMILDHGGDINQRESEGDTPLILASTTGHLSVVEMLLYYGCDVNRANDLKSTALLQAADRGHLDIVRTLIDNGADISAVDTELDSALTFAASKGHTDVVKLLLKTGLDVTHVNRWGRNALHEACSLWTGPTDTVSVLLQVGMDPDQSDNVQSTPLILATMSSQDEAVYELLRANCDPNKPGESVGQLVKPVQVAVARECFNIARILYLTGANMNAVNVWMESENGPVYSVPVKHNEMKEWLKMITQSPTPLKFLCRFHIRRSLSVGLEIERQVQSLPLPRSVVDFLLLKDVRDLLNSCSDDSCSDDSS